MPLSCFICSQSLTNFSVYRRHLWSYHSIHHSGVEVKCGQKFCPRVFVNFSTLRNHIQQCHSDLMKADESELSSAAVEPVLTESGDDDVNIDVNVGITDVQQFHEAINKVDITDITSSCLQFFTLLQQKSNMTQANIQLVADNLKHILADVSNYSVSQTKKMCLSVGLDSTNPAVAVCLDNLNSIRETMDNIDTQHKRKVCLSESGYLIKPLEISLGKRTETRFKSALGFNSTVVVEDTMQYVPLDLLLGSILCDDYYSRKLSEFAECKTANPDEISHFFHTEQYRKHAFFQMFPHALALHFYVDAFEVTNPLGSHTTVHKLEALYMTVLNLATEEQSKLSSIFLVALWHAQDVKTYKGYDKIFEPVVRDLQKLESDNGAVVEVRGKKVCVRAALVLMSADNLGINSLFGFCEGFNAKKFCRFCECSREETDNKFIEADFTLRSCNSYDNAVLSLCDASYDHRTTGIKRKCILNELKYFHVMQNFTVDAMHDFLEGIAPFELGLLLQELQVSEFVTVEMLNSAIMSFDYGAADRNSRPPTLLHMHTVKMSASEMWCFLRNLPIMIGKHIPRDNEFWKLLTMLLDIADIIFAPTITKGLSGFLGQLIDDHHTYFKELFVDDKRLLPKHHFLVHYPNCMLKSGPPVRYWCMRFEARHQFFKELARLSHGYRNICQTLANRFQLSLANLLMNPRAHKSHVKLGPCSDVLVNSLGVDQAEVICGAMSLCKQDVIYVAKRVEVGHYTFQKQAVAVLDVIEGQPLFGIVKEVIALKTDVFLLVELLISQNYDSHFHSYPVKHSSQRELACVPLQSLKDHVPLHLHAVDYEGNTHLLVSMRYTLF